MRAERQEIHKRQTYFHTILDVEFLISDSVEVSSVANDSSENRSSVADVSLEVVTLAVVYSLAEDFLARTSNRIQNNPVITLSDSDPHILY